MEYLRKFLSLGIELPTAKKASGCASYEPTWFENAMYYYGVPLLIVLVFVAFVMMIFFLVQICTPSFCRLFFILL